MFFAHQAYPPKKDIASLTERFLKLLSPFTVRTFPDVHPVLVHVYDSSGYALQYNKWKISIHLIWGDIVVDDTRAQLLRQHIVESLERMSNSTKDEENFGLPDSQMARSMQSELSQLHIHNTWHKIIDGCHSGLRVPLCDKRVFGYGKDEEGKRYRFLYPKEGRVKEPVGTWQFDFRLNQTLQVVTRDQESDDMWVLKGLCLCSEDLPLTPWREPQLLQKLQKTFHPSGNPQQPKSKKKQLKKQQLKMKQHGKEVLGTDEANQASATTKSYPAR